MQYRPFDELGLHGLASEAGLCIVLVNRFAVIAVPERHRTSDVRVVDGIGDSASTVNHHDRMGKGVGERLVLRIPERTEVADEEGDRIHDVKEVADECRSNANGLTGCFAHTTNANSSHSP